MSLLESNYEPLVTKTRQRLSTDVVLNELVNPLVDPTQLHRFLIEYSALGVQMTQPVDQWIRRAGERTEELGLASVGLQLKQHAKHEEGHHLMLIEDTKTLAARWKAQFPAEPVNAQATINQPASPAMRAYIDLHEEVIASSRPFAQVAIELEIESLALSWAPAFVANVKAVLGADVASDLSFLKEHIAIDIGHTAFNRRLMNILLEARPADVDAIAAVGRRALTAYLDFLNECWLKTEQLLGGKLRQVTAISGLGGEVVSQPRNQPR